MTLTRISCDKMKYDKQHDVLHIFLGSPINAFADEEFPGIYVSRDEDTNDIVELTVMDFKKKKKLLTKYFPQFLFDYCSCIF